MNFFEHQEQARRTSTRLVALFALYVLVLVVVVNGVMSWIYQSAHAPRYAAVPLSWHVGVTLTVLGLIGAGTLFKVLELREGGVAAARMVGGRAVDASTRDLLERRLLNVVEEMALAAGLSPPRVYVLDSEPAINAFAAGHSPNEAVIAVTRGTLTRLSRDELQGVIGHEFSHILNGDMALNLRLVGVLHGLLVVALAGRYLMELVGRSRGNSGGSSGKSDGALAMAFMLGLLLWLLGYLGVLVGRIIKAGVSRQREFLADASSVQFTRNPDGIGGALRKIGNADAHVGSLVHHPQSEALSHMFMAPAMRALDSGWLATHPPLQERVQRIYGRSMPWLAAPEQALALEMQSAALQPPASQDAPLEFTSALSPVAGLMQSASTLSPERVVAQVGQMSPMSAQGNQEAQANATRNRVLEEAAVNSMRAPWVIYALLIDKESDLHAQQRQRVTEALGPGAAQTLDALHEHAQHLGPGERLPLLERAASTLMKLGGPERTQVLRLAHALIAADGQVTLMEFLLFTVLRRRLGPHAGRAVAVKYRTLAALTDEVGLVLSLLAALRLPEKPEHAFNAGLILLPGVQAQRTDVASISLDAVSAALDRLNQLAPLAKPAFIKACTATTLVDGSTHWKAASCLRTVCTAIDAPLPPMLSHP